jgi:uncharacterized membrane protein YeiB
MLPISKCKEADTVPGPSYKSFYDANKKEAFDGMRAYHQSEIAHKKDAIDLLKQILVSGALIYTGLIAALFTNKVPKEAIVALSYVLTLIVGLAVFHIVVPTNKKIEQDHKRYIKYAQEYIITRQIMGIEKDLIEHGFVSVWTKYQINTKSGYSFTKRIVTTFGFIVFFIALFATLVIYVAAKIPDTK